jgi:acetylornithine aminotransferase
MEEEGLLANAASMGEIVMTGLRDALKGVAGVKEVRGMGLMIGIELDRPCGEIAKMALDADLFINVTQDSVIRLLPPLIINEAEARELVARLVPVIQSFLAVPHKAAA